MSSAEAKNQAINFLSPSETGKEIAATDKSPKSQADLFANAARDKVFEVAGRAGETANAAKDSIGAGLETVGEDLSKSVLGDGTFSDMAKSIACKIENSGTYLRQSTMKEMGRDLGKVIRRHPVAFVLAGCSLGYLITRAYRTKTQIH